MESLIVLLWKCGLPFGPGGGPNPTGKAFPPDRGLRPITEVISFMAENSLGCGAGLGGRGTPTGRDALGGMLLLKDPYPPAAPVGEVPLLLLLAVSGWVALLLFAALLFISKELV